VGGGAPIFSRAAAFTACTARNGFGFFLLAKSSLWGRIMQ
jgi:hypothetical protein